MLDRGSKTGAWAARSPRVTLLSIYQLYRPAIFATTAPMLSIACSGTTQ